MMVKTRFARPIENTTDAVSVISKDIIKEMDDLQISETGEVLFGDHLQNYEDTEQYMDLVPDVEIEDNLLSNQIILGCYVPMKSPGLVRLAEYNLRSFFWGLIKSLTNRPLGAFITRPDLEKLAVMIVQETFFHEIFHFGCDVMRHLFGSSYIPLQEEALAVAYSRMRIASLRENANSATGRINTVLYHAVFQMAFQYNSPGYRDWHQYSDETRFKAGLLDYVQPGKYQALVASGVAAEDILYNILENVKGFQQQIIR
jgi:hypothetical protein